MDCRTSSSLTNREFMELWGREAEADRVPLSGTIELTRHCNLRCVHCYLPRHDAQQGSELSTEEILSILDQIAAAGCLFLLITGGDPLLRPDFPVIYRRAKENGLLVTVFTNGTLVSDRIAALFEELPPHRVEVTLYGSTARIHEAITGEQGSFQRCLEGIERLTAAGVRLGLKTILMTLNRNEVQAIEDLTRALGASFRLDAAICPRLDGNLFPLSLRVSPREAVAAEFSDPARRRDWIKFASRFDRARRLAALPTPQSGTDQDISPASIIRTEPSMTTGIRPVTSVQASVERARPDPASSLYQCGAGLTGFHIDPFGNLGICLMAGEPRYSLRSGSFEEGWRGPVVLARSRKAREGSPCLDCATRELCSYCPGFFTLETGNPESPSQYLCELGHLRHEQIRHLLASTDERQ